MAGNQLWHQDVPDVLGKAEDGDWFGRTLAAADFGNGSQADLAVGAVAEDVGDISGAGAVNVLYGSPAGLSTLNNQQWHQGSPDVLGAVEAGDRFGRALTATNFGNGPQADLAIGIAGEDVGDIIDAGAVSILYGSSSGLSAANNQLGHQDTPGILGVAEAGDVFGCSLASNHSSYALRSFPCPF